jgi:hypothetical protein
MENMVLLITPENLIKNNIPSSNLRSGCIKIRSSRISGMLIYKKGGKNGE